eukprot:SAG31_NODE_33590_length_342_cov_0.699588_2_plen_42_part_01
MSREVEPVCRWPVSALLERKLNLEAVCEKLQTLTSTQMECFR